MATRGRPKKVTQPAEKVETENSSPATSEASDPGTDLAAMQNQIKYQLAQLVKMAEGMGVDVGDMFPTPPKETTVVLEPEPEIHPQARASRPDVVTVTGGAPPEDKIDKRTGRLKPGTVLPGGNWIPWTKNDLDPDEYIDFVPAPVPSLVFPMTDEEGRQKIKIDVNDLTCWLTVGVSNRVNKMFYNVYMDGYNSWKDLEYFKRHGPAIAPWGNQGPNGRPAWHYEPFSLTFGMDIDGRYLSAGRSPIEDAKDENPEAI